MINALILASIRHRHLVGVLALLLAGFGLWSAMQLPIDAVPDVTNKQVQINTVAPALAPAEVERQITFPIEVALSGIPHLKETRSVSQFGLSQVTAIFADNADLYFARQQVNERLQNAREQLPPGTSPPRMAPVSTGLGEVLTLVVEGPQSLMERRTLLDWVVKPQLRTVPGVVEINSFGGEVQQYQVLVDPQKLLARGLTLRRVQEALQENNRNAGGGYLRRGDEQQLVRGIGVIQGIDDLRQIVLGAEGGTPIYLGEVAEVRVGPALRQGAATMDGKGEAVLGITMLLMGENGRVVVERTKDRLRQIEKSLPAGTKLIPFLDRSELINHTLQTAAWNLVEGGVLVVLVLFLFLLQLRAGLIVSSAIPLAMLFAIIGMKQWGISANLMSLGAIDFGLIVDAAVIIVENCVRRLSELRKELGRDLTETERLDTIYAGAVEVRQASQFGELIIIAAYLPVLTLVGIEGKMFRPMGLTVILALVGALLLSVTLVPALCAFFLRVRRERENPVLERLAHGYEPALRWAVRHRGVTVGGALLFFLLCASLFPRLGSEFIPELDEGAVAIGVVNPPSISLEKAIERSGQVERALKTAFPDEIDRIVTRIGRPEVATDPMLPSQSDVIVSLKPRSGWRQVHNREELVTKMASVLEDVPGVGASFSQPIKMRMSELIEGVGIRSDLGIKLFGEDMEVLAAKGEEIARVLRSVPGAADVTVETTAGLPVLNLTVRRDEIARYGINVADVQAVIETAVGGSAVGEIIQGDQRVDLTVRLAEPFRKDAEAIGRIQVPAPGGGQIPLSQLAEIVSGEGPVQVSRENGQRRVVIQANVRNRDLGGFVQEAETRLERAVKLPAGYHLEYGGTYEHLQSGRARLALVLPVTFGVIFLLLFTTFGSVRQAALVFTGIPFAVTGGILALLARGMHFSMSAGIGFIALFGVAVLNGVVLLTFINHLRAEGMTVREAVIRGCVVRLRPVLMTAAVASIGFLPMALAHGAGAEVQKPLATVVIGGLLTSTALTLFVLPALYAWFERNPPGSVLPAGS